MGNGARVAAMAAALVMLSGAAARADGTLWSVSVYAGPATNDYATDILFGGRFRVEGAMLGIAVDRNVAYLGAGFKLVAEAQATHYFLDQPTSTFGLGLGLKYTGLKLGPHMPMGVAFYMGPSYAVDPPLYADAGTITRYRWLNYVSTEVTVGIPGWRRWEVAFRSYHRSGLYGVYAHNVDEGSMIGAGLRYRF